VAIIKKDDLTYDVSMGSLLDYIKKNDPLPAYVMQNEVFRLFEYFFISNANSKQIGILRTDVLERLFSSGNQKELIRLSERMFDVSNLIKLKLYQFLGEQSRGDKKDKSKEAIVKNCERILEKLAVKIDGHWKDFCNELDKKIKRRAENVEHRDLVDSNSGSMLYLFVNELPSLMRQSELLKWYLYDPGITGAFLKTFPSAKLYPNGRVLDSAPFFLDRILSRSLEEKDALFEKLESAREDRVQLILDAELWLEANNWIKNAGVESENEYNESVENIKNLFIKMDNDYARMRDAVDKEKENDVQELTRGREQFLKNLISLLRDDYLAGRGKLMRSFFEDKNYGHRIQFINALKDIQDKPELANQTEFLKENDLLYKFIARHYDPEMKVSPVVSNKKTETVKDVRDAIRSALDKNRHSEITKLLCQDTPPYYQKDVLDKLVSENNSRSILVKLTSRSSSKRVDDELLMEILRIESDELLMAKRAIYGYMADVSPNSSLLKAKWRDFIADDLKVLSQNRKDGEMPDPIMVVALRNLPWITNDDLIVLYKSCPDVFYNNSEYAKLIMTRLLGDSEEVRAKIQCMAAVDLIAQVRSDPTVEKEKDRSIVKDFFDKNLPGYFQKEEKQQEQVASVEDEKRPLISNVDDAALRSSISRSRNRSSSARRDSEFDYDGPEAPLFEDKMGGGGSGGNTAFPSIRVRGIEDWPQILNVFLSWPLGAMEWAARQGGFNRLANGISYPRRFIQGAVDICSSATAKLTDNFRAEKNKKYGVQYKSLTQLVIEPVKAKFNAVKMQFKAAWADRSAKRMAKRELQKSSESIPIVLNGDSSSEVSEIAKKPIKHVHFADEEKPVVPEVKMAPADEKIVAATKLLKKSPEEVAQKPDVVADGMEAYLQRILEQLKAKQVLEQQGLFGVHHSPRNSLSSNSSSDSLHVDPNKPHT